MKKILFSFLAFGFMSVCVNTYATGIQEYYADKGFLDNIGKQWLLTNVDINGSDTGFKRDELKGMANEDELFSLKFDSGTLSGTGAPNRFSGPYTEGEKQTLIIMPMRSTLMASIFEPESLKEHDFYNYLQNAYRWERIEYKLKIYSKPGDQEVVMTFYEYYLTSTD
jgi:heat shock protein HslJ